MHFYRELGPLILGSRLKRMSDRLLSNINKVYQQEGIPFDATWFPIFYLLDKQESISLVEISEQLEVSHSAISQLISNLEKKQLVRTEKDPFDGRKRQIVLTKEGIALKDKVKTVWSALTEAINELIDEGQSSSALFDGLSELEENMDKLELQERIAEKLKVHVDVANTVN